MNTDPLKVILKTYCCKTLEKTKCTQQGSRCGPKNIKVIAESKNLLTHNIETIVNDMELKSRPVGSRCGSTEMRQQEKKVEPELKMSEDSCLDQEDNKDTDYFQTLIRYSHMLQNTQVKDGSHG